MTQQEIKEFYEQAFSDQAGVSMVETHASWVILTTDKAFKIKKAIEFSFLDFSSLEKRKEACENEVELNRRLAPEMYLGVWAIGKVEGVWTISEKAETYDNGALEYAVVMTRMDNELEMDELLKKDAVYPEHIIKLAKMLADFHDKIKTVEIEVTEDRLREEFNDLLVVRDWLKSREHPVLVEQLEEGVRISDKFIEENIELFRKRNEEGWIRNCHGDLHSRNIFLYPEPVIFDCIEFNPEFREIDLLNEVAFFCMDLEFYRKKDLSDLFVEEWVKHFYPETKVFLPHLFLYYKAYRANVRAKVAGLKAMNQVDENDVHSSIREVASYLELMAGYLGELFTTAF